MGPQSLKNEIRTPTISINVNQGGITVEYIIREILVIAT